MDSIFDAASTISSSVGLDAAELHDRLLTEQPEGARHDADSCPFCSETAQSSDSRAPLTNNELPTEGFEVDMSEDMISRETHEALLEKAMKDGLTALELALEGKSQALAEAEAKGAELASENERIARELDAAQLEMKSKSDELDAIKAELASKAEEARLAELAAKRAEQVENLGLFTKEYVADKASKWASMEDADWADRLEEWRSLKPAAAATGDSASSMTGTSEDLTAEPPVETASHIPARRAALGLN